MKRYNGLYHYNAHRTVYMGTYNEEQPIPSMCHLQIVQTEEETVIVATELATNMGMSITNAWEWLATCVVREYELDPQRTRFIEHYGPASDRDASRPDTYDEVLFTWSGTDAEQPQWRRLQGAELAALHAITAEGLHQDDNLPYLGL